MIVRYVLIPTMVSTEYGMHGIMHAFVYIQGWALAGVTFLYRSRSNSSNSLCSSSYGRPELPHTSCATSNMNWASTGRCAAVLHESMMRPRSCQGTAIAKAAAESHVDDDRGSVGCSSRQLPTASVSTALHRRAASSTASHHTPAR